MPLIYAGIDEAGYGPLLGPLCVGLTVFRVDAWDEGNAPNLWTLLNGAVCRSPSDKRKRIAVDDSKALKLANSTTTRHPLTHLERGVLAFMLCRELEEACAELSECPASDLQMLELLGAERPGHQWYAGEGSAFPLAHSAAEVAITKNRLATAMSRASVAMLEVACRVICEESFNAIVRDFGTKAAATESALVQHLRLVWERWGAVGATPGSGVRVVCDRQGGRASYEDMLSRAIPGARVIETHRSAECSRYELSSTDADEPARTMHVVFLTESEKQHLPVALASMAAKLTRETLMARLNRHFAARLPELKPTAGYRTDGWRWLEDAKPILTESERRVLIRCC